MSKAEKSLILSDPQRFILESPYKINLFMGGTGCFSPDQKVVTDIGSVPISELKSGDIVKTFSIKKKKTSFNKILSVFRYKNEKKTYEIKLKNGEKIVATDDHKFYYEGGWITLKHLLSLWDDKMETNTRV